MIPSRVLPTPDLVNFLARLEVLPDCTSFSSFISCQVLWPRKAFVSSLVKLHTCALRFSQEINRDFRVHYKGPQKSSEWNTCNQEIKIGGKYGSNKTPPVSFGFSCPANGWPARVAFHGPRTAWRSPAPAADKHHHNHGYGRCDCGSRNSLRDPGPSHNHNLASRHRDT